MEITGGSLAHGLGIAVGMALGLKRKSSNSRVYNLLSDGELDEGSTWRPCSRRPLATRQPDRHRRRQQPAGGWSFDERAQLRATGAEMGGVRLARAAGRRQRHGRRCRRSTRARELNDPRPRVIICDTKMAKGVPSWRGARRRISCGWNPTSGNSLLRRSTRGGPHD